MSEPTFHICWTMDCESSHPDVHDPALGEQSVRGFTEILNEVGWSATLFAMPGELAALHGALQDAAAEGHELGIHVHPRATGEASDYLGTYSFEEQVRILRTGMGTLQEQAGSKPVSCRPGYCSANDATFRAMAECGIRQASSSMPGRRMSQLASNWSGAPLFAHYAHADNRFLCGSMDLVEIPITVDWESMIWGGVHPQDLRVEYTDAKNHSFLIEKVMRRQVEENLPLKAIVVLTHNLFRYDDPANFRRETMWGMIDAVRRCAEKLHVHVAGSTIAGAAQAFRNAASQALDKARTRGS